MKQLQIKHWQDPVNALLGAWLVVSPWVLGYQAETAAMANAVVIGLALAAASLGAIFVPRAWEAWTEAILGLWLVASPWLLGFSGLDAAMATAAISGVVVLALALWELAIDKEYTGWWQGIAH